MNTDRKTVQSSTGGRIQVTKGEEMRHQRRYTARIRYEGTERLNRVSDTIKGV